MKETETGKERRLIQARKRLRGARKNGTQTGKACESSKERKDRERERDRQGRRRTKARKEGVESNVYTSLAGSAPYTKFLLL